MNNTTSDYPTNQCIHQLFESQVECTPHSIAVIFEDSSLTYQELNNQANQLLFIFSIISGISSCLPRSHPS